MDTLEGNEEDPISLHRYLYVSSNPVNMVDPSGNEGLGDLTVSIAIQGQLFVMAHPILTTVVTAALLTLAPDDVINSLPPAFGAEVGFVSAVETEVKELNVVRRLYEESTGIARTEAGRNFERWMIDRVLGNIIKDSEQLVVKDGAEVVGQARVRGSAVIDAVIQGVVTEFKTSFGAVKKYQAQQFAKYAKGAGGVVEYVFLHEPSTAEIKQLQDWIREAGSEVKLVVTYIVPR